MVDADKQTTEERPTFLTKQQLLAETLPKRLPARLAVRVSLDLSSPTQIASRLRDLGAAIGGKMRAAFDAHLANMSEESQQLAMKLTFAECNKVAPAVQALMVRMGRDASIVAEAAVRQRRVAPVVQEALVAECSQHTVAMRELAGRADATIESLAALASSADKATRMNVAANLGARMRVQEPLLSDAKQAVFDGMVARYESDFSPYLVPVCRDPEQLQSMYERTSKTLGVIDVFVDNPHSPESVLVDIAASSKMHVIQREAAQKARDALLVRASHSSSANDDIAPP